MTISSVVVVDDAGVTHQIRQEIMSNVRDISHITSQILQIYEFAEPDQKTQTKQFWFGSDSSRSRVRFGSSSTYFSACQF